MVNSRITLQNTCTRIRKSMWTTHSHTLTLYLREENSLEIPTHNQPPTTITATTVTTTDSSTFSKTALVLASRQHAGDGDDDFDARMTTKQAHGRGRFKATQLHIAGALVTLMVVALVVLVVLVHWSTLSQTWRTSTSRFTSGSPEWECSWCWRAMMLVRGGGGATRKRTICSGNIFLSHEIYMLEIFLV